MLTNKEISILKKIAHQEEILKFNIGKEHIDENVINMLKNALLKHELIKISFLKSAMDEVNKEEMILDLLSILHCELVQSIGNTILIYKHSPKLKNPIRFK